jgi:hypothetical protein
MIYRDLRQSFVPVNGLRISGEERGRILAELQGGG